MSLSEPSSPLGKAAVEVWKQLQNPSEYPSDEAKAVPDQEKDLGAILDSASEEGSMERTLIG